MPGTDQHHIKLVVLEYILWMSQEALKAQKIQLAAGGRLPDPKSANMELVFGNGVLTSFSEKSTGKGYWETGQLPDIDLSKDQMFLILDQDGYYQSQNKSMGMGGSEGGSEAGGTQTSNKPPNFHISKISVLFPLNLLQ